MVAGFERIEMATAQDASNITAKIQNLGTITSELHTKMHDTVKKLHQSIVPGLNTNNSQLKSIQWMLKDMQLQLAARAIKDSEENINDHLQDCIDRLYEINDKRTGDTYIDSDEVQEVTDDVVEILKIILDKLTVIESHKTQGKRKLGEYEDDGDEIQLEMQERREVKRMRGILDSTSSADIRDISELIGWFV